MFYALAAVLCCAVLFIVLAGASVISAGLLWTARNRLQSLAPRTGANWMFALRALPFLLTMFVTLGFVLPSFLRFEPRSTGEIMSARLLLLAACGGLIFGGMMVRCWRVIRATRRARQQWRSQSTRLQLEAVQAPVYRAEGNCPLLAVTGTFRPEIFIAEGVTQSLSPSELSAAIAHELAHVSSLDNLKQMFLKITQLPRWLNLFRRSDAAWRSAAEVAADEGALASGASALDLSCALVKVGRLSRHVRVSDAVAASHLLPEAAESCIAARVMHLKKRMESGPFPRMQNASGRKSYWPVFSLALLVLGYAICVNAVLPWMHEVLELLVR